MQVELHQVCELTIAHWSRWREIQRHDVAYDSPFFCPEFIQTVDRVRGDAEVAVLSDDDNIVGFFPFQRTSRFKAEPVGGTFSEAHGVVIDSSVQWDATKLLRECCLRRWEYHHVPSDLGQFHSGREAVGTSPYMDLSAGFQVYRELNRRRGSSIARRVGQLTRKLERDVGPLHFVRHDASDVGMRCLLDWKSAQHRRTGVPDVFQTEWVQRLLREVQALQSSGCSGLLSVLYADDQPIAVHLGMKTPTTAHAWYPAFNRDFAKYSPGILLFFELAKVLAAEGVERLEFGPGGQVYKDRLCTNSRAVIRGVTGLRLPEAIVRQTVARAKNWASELQLRERFRAGSDALFRRRVTQHQTLD